MPRQAGIVVENNFRNGLVTEASGINFPENACTETYNCKFWQDGSVTRRFGFDFEPGHFTKNIDRANSAINTYLWKNVAGNGDITVVVVQVGMTLYFYKTNESSISEGALVDTVSLTEVSDAPEGSAIEAQFCDGNGQLFVTHPYCDPIRISFDTTDDTLDPVSINLKIRDLEGVDDGLDVDERPTTSLASMDDDHEYNLRNQGWNTTNLTAWDSAQTTMPSNADVMWTFKNSSDNFSAANDDINRVVRGNTPAPKGHYILTLADQDRDAAAGTSDVPSTTTGYQRPSTAAFFAGRVFYSGINYIGFNSKIYFTQIIEREEQYEYCYQVNDPTSEETFDLLPTDGGVININEAGTIIKLVNVPGGLVVFAANGVWFITGSTGLGFTATDYTVQKISSIPTLTASSFVDVAGFPCWWNAEGIYIVISETSSSPRIQSLTDSKIKQFYEEIPLNSKRKARGFYHNIDNQIQWIYKSTNTDQVTESYEFDMVLNFNVLTGAFWPWTITDSDVKVHGIIVTDSTSGATSINTVIDSGGDTVVDSNGDQVISFEVSGAVNAPFAKFLVSYADSGTYKFTFGEEANQDYVDWFIYDSTGVNYESYFITGYKLRGEGLRKFQSNWVRVFSCMDEPTQYYFQGIWDFASSGDTGRWSSRQLVQHTDENYTTVSKRLKVRGHGIALQFKVSSLAGMPFDIVGWSAFETVNQLP